MTKCTVYYKNDFSTDDIDGSNRRQRLRKNLVDEQGKICCYCMRRISTNSSHIEHFLPKEIFTDKDLSYENLLASCNGEGTVVFDDEEYSKEEIRNFIEYYTNKDNGVYVPYCKAIVCQLL